MIRHSSILREKVFAYKAKVEQDTKYHIEAIISAVWISMVKAAEQGKQSWVIPNTITGISITFGRTPPTYRIDIDAIGMIVAEIKAQDGYTVTETQNPETGLFVYTINW